MPYRGIVDADREDPAAQGAADAYETLRILLTAHCELTETAADQSQDLRALLLRGGPRDRHLSRGGLSYGVLFHLARRTSPTEASDAHVARNDEIQRLAQVLIAYRDELAANRDQMTTLVNQLVPGITDEPRMGPFTAAKAILDSGPFTLDEFRSWT